MRSRATAQDAAPPGRRVLPGPFSARLKLSIVQGGAAAITATPSMVFATRKIPGTVILMAVVHVPGTSMDFTFPTEERLPIGHGRREHALVSEATIFAFMGSASVDLYAWTPGTSTFTGLTSDFAPLPDVVAMGSFALSAQGGGTVTLVAPTRLRIDGLGLQGRTLSVTTLKLTFVPEPGTLLLLAVAGAALALGAARTRRQQATKS